MESRQEKYGNDVIPGLALGDVTFPVVVNEGFCSFSRVNILGCCVTLPESIGLLTLYSLRVPFGTHCPNFANI